ncbi:MAG TPA: CaiB/BaiF CoA-transferase family protein [Bacteroidia bacterium]|jgi:crotonobetainyl-CoA:carnitine CoA-transferase CaiB-like acyl-CoA transferase|nr:CaiB/BaiF CoA-transferase family protein [Bacteroidia bacterium]
MDTFFKDLKVVELANVLAGPAVGLFFAELGASVIKIENKRSNGDVTRSWKLPVEDKDSNYSAYYASVNWNKTSLFIDLETPEERQQVYTLIKEADVVISNYKKGDDLKLQMDYKHLHELNPSLVYAHISGFGDDSSRTAFDLILQAETGFMYMNGTPETGPLKMPVALIDVLAAHQLKEGILIALIKRMKAGKGSYVTVSLKDAAISSLANQASNWLMAGYNHQPSGSLHPNIAPYGEVFTTLDSKKMVLAIGNEKQFAKLCEVLNRIDIIQNPIYNTNTQRIKNRESLFKVLQETISEYAAEPLLSKLIQEDVPAGIVKSVEDVFTDTSVHPLILRENSSNQASQRVKTSIFKISEG